MRYKEKIKLVLVVLAAIIWGVTMSVTMSEAAKYFITIVLLLGFWANVVIYTDNKNSTKIIQTIERTCK